MTPEQRVSRARALMDDALFLELMGDMERAAINAAVYAPPTDHDARAAAIGEVRAIRDVKAKLAAIVRDANPPRKAAPA